MDKVILVVTGASRGIGKAVAEQALSLGMHVVGIARSQNPGIHSGNLSWISLDLSNESLVAESAKALFGSLSGRQTTQGNRGKKYDTIALVNNAGTLGSLGLMGNLDSADLSLVMKLNVITPLQLSNMFVRILGKTDAKKYIVNVSSGAGRTPYAGWSAYCASKAALDMMSRCLALEQDSRHNPVHVVSFAPGIVDTSMQHIIAKAGKEDFPLADRFREFRESGQMLDPRVPAKVILDIVMGNRATKNVLQDIREG